LVEMGEREREREKERRDGGLRVKRDKREISKPRGEEERFR